MDIRAKKRERKGNKREKKEVATPAQAEAARYSPSVIGAYLAANLGGGCLAHKSTNTVKQEAKMTR
jgi:hypothetical protein